MNFANGCSSLARVVLSKVIPIESIGAGAFMGCTGLTAIKVSSSIGNSAFSGCTSLKSAELARGVKSIGISAFYNCSKLEALRVPDTVTSIGNGFIQECTGLKTLEIQALLTDHTLTANQMLIGAASQLDNLILGGTIENLEEKCLANGSNGFSNLTYVTLPP